MNDPLLEPAPRVLAVIDTAHIGGPGKGLLQLVRFTEQPSDAALQLATFTSRRHRSTEFIERCRTACHEPILFRERFRFDPAVVAQAVRVVRDGRIQILQSHGYKSDILACIVRRITGVRWIAVMHGWTAENSRIALYQSLDKFVLRFPDATVAVSASLAREADQLRNRDGRTFFVPNAVDPSDLPHGPEAGRVRALHAPGKKYVLGVFGRLSPEKGHAVLLEALGALSKDLRDRMALLVAGDGPERRRLEEKAIRLGLQDTVRFLGYQAFPRDYFEALDLLVLPSLSEGLPNALLEGYIYGVPAVATRVGEVTNIVADAETGWLADPGDRAGLAHALTRALILTPEALQAVGRKGQARIRQDYSPRTRAEKFHTLYRSLVDEQSTEAQSSLRRPSLRRPARGSAQLRGNLAAHDLICRS